MGGVNTFAFWLGTCRWTENIFYSVGFELICHRREIGAFIRYQSQARILNGSPFNMWGFLFFYYYIYIRYFLLAQTFGYRRMDVRVLGRSFNYVAAPEIYYTQVLVWIFNVTFCISISSSCSRVGTHLQFVLDAFNTFRVLGSSRDIAYTSITHITIPWSFCKYTLFPNVKIIYLCNRCTFVRQEQSSHGISECDNISSRQSRTSGFGWWKFK